MASNTEISSFALSVVGAEPLTDFDADTTKTARHCRIQLPRLRDNLNATYRWNFAMTRVALGGAASPAPVWDFDNAYTLPTDLLRLWETDISRGVQWRVEAKQLLTDAADVNILYSKLVTAADDFTVGFRMVLEHLLAASLCIPILRDSRLRRELLEESQVLLLDALATESHENKPPIVDTDELIIARQVEPFIELDVS